MTTVPAAATVRLDAHTREAIGAYMERNDMNFSQAIRVLCALALRDEETADEIFRRAAFKEGIVEGIAAMRERLREAINKALTDLEDR